MDLAQLYHSAEEHPEFVEVQISGKVPTWLRGSFYKVGNGKFDLPGGFCFSHTYEGFGIIYHYEIADGKVRYRSRFLNSDAYTKAMHHGTPQYTEYATRAFSDPNKNFLSRAFARFVPGAVTDNNCGNIVQFRGKLFVTSEAYLVMQLDRHSLTYTHKADLKKVLGVDFSTSHYLEDPGDGSTYTAAAAFTASGFKQYVVRYLPRTTKPESISEPETFKDGEFFSTFSSRWKTCFPFTHSFALTEKYIIIVDQPLLVNGLKFVAALVKGKSHKDSLEWAPDENTRFVVIKKSSGKVVKTKFLAPAIFFYHVVNAYDDDGHVVVDINAHQTPALMDKLSLTNMRNNEYDQTDPQHIHRYVLPIGRKDLKSKDNLNTLAGSTAEAKREEDGVIFCTPEKIGDPGLEYPNINIPKSRGKKYRYVYGTGLFNEGRFRRGIGKLNVQTRESKVWRAEESQVLSEPFFVPNPNGTDEDDGVIITTLLDSQKDNYQVLLFIDAKSFTEVGRAEIPHRTIVGNHSLFVPEYDEH